MKELTIKFRNEQKLGDTLLMTCAIRDLKRARPGWKIHVQTNHMDVWQNNPHLSKDPWQEQGSMTVWCGTKRACQQSSSSGLHIANGYRLSFEDRLGIPIEQGPIAPEIFFTKEELLHPAIEAKHYWVITTGAQRDFGAKAWLPDRWQALVSRFPSLLFVQIGSPHDEHPRLQGENVIDLIGRTQNLRTLFRLFHFAVGSLGALSAQMHLAAALNKPCVTISGGREPATFAGYNIQRFLHNVGSLACCRDKACWSCTLDACRKKGGIGESGFPKCMELISVDQVEAALRSYYDGGRLELPYVQDNRQMQQVIDSGPRQEPEPPHEQWVQKTGEVLKKGLAPVVKPQKRVFRMIANTHGWGGGERSVVWILNAMREEGYHVQLAPVKPVISAEFKRAVPYAEITQHVTQPCDLLMLYANDSVFSWDKPQWDCFNNLRADRKIMVLNYRLGKAGQVPWTQNWDVYVFLCGDLCKDFNKRYNSTKVGLLNTYVLAPPVELGPFLRVRPAYNSRMNVVRHTSQPEQKYSDSLREKIEMVSEKLDATFQFMPSSEITRANVQNHEADSMPVPSFLGRGNVYWYDLPDRYLDNGPRVVIEAMAAGLPVIGTAYGGLLDRVASGTGHLYDSPQSMIEAFNMLRGTESRRTAGENARNYAVEEFRPEKWTKMILDK